jgi:hypothetical protein
MNWNDCLTFLLLYFPQTIFSAIPALRFLHSRLLSVHGHFLNISWENAELCILPTQRSTFRTKGLQFRLANPTDWRRGRAVGLDRSQVVNRSIENILVLVGDRERSSGLAKQFGSCETLDGIDNIVVSLSEVAIHRASRDRTGV